MAVITKASLTIPVLPKETVEVPELGGEVVVRGLLLSERLGLLSGLSERQPENEDGRKPDGEMAAKFASLSVLLASTVVDANGEQLMTAEQWEIFGSQHFDRALSLALIAKRLSGLDAEQVEKN